MRFPAVVRVDAHAIYQRRLLIFFNFFLGFVFG